MSAFTPIIKPLNTNGTTFYTFSSAARDLSKCLANNDKEFVFSHFVCLDLPNIINPSRDTEPDASYQGDSSSYSRNNGNYYQNFLQLVGIDSVLDRCSAEQQRYPSSKRFAELMQDYLFNMEELLISESNDNDTDRSVAERVFWHFLKEMGAVNWIDGSSKASDYLNNHNMVRFMEGCDMFNGSDTGYRTVVKYIGNIDITNNVDIANEAYTEVYVHIPSEAGNTPTVLFKEEYDGNYESGRQYNAGIVHQNTDYILGKNSENPNPNGITYRALYDDQTNHSYDTDAESHGTAVTNTKSHQAGNYSSYMYRTSLDGMCIDFDANSYKDIVSGGMVTMDDYNKSSHSGSFEFNCVLVYYDIVDKSSGSRTPNLYGVLFLDDIHTDKIWDYFQRYPKYKPISGVQNGNSYGFKLNLRIDIEPNKQGVTTLVNEYNTFSMSLFSDAMTRMLQSADMFTRMNTAVNGINGRLTDLENVLLFMTSYSDLVRRVDEIERSIENANLAFADRNTLVDLIARNSDDINSIVRGRLTQRLQYNTDVVHGGYGIEVDSSVPDEITLRSAFNGYAIPKVSVEGTVIGKSNPICLNAQNRTNNEMYFRLKEFTNMVRVYVDTATDSAHDIVFKIDDTFTSWREGQTVRVVFPNMTHGILNGYNIAFKTDAQDKGGNGEWNCGVVIQASELIGDFPVIELVCTDPTLTGDCFEYDILR